MTQSFRAQIKYFVNNNRNATIFLLQISTICNINMEQIHISMALVTMDN